MAKKRPGKLWFKFKLYGFEWEARIFPSNSKLLDNGATAAFVLLNERLLGFSDSLTNEQLRTGFAHELQHIIEEHADVNYEEKVPSDVADRLTDQVGRGWLYFIRENPGVCAFLRDEKP